MIRLPHLETNVTVACTRRCQGCNHFVPLQVRDFKRSMVEPAALARDLAIFSRLAHAEAYALIGGEPLMHPQIVDLMKVANRSGVADAVEVWTNGELLREQSVAFWEALDVLVVSVYPGVLDDDDLAWIEERCEAYGAGCVVKDERRVPNFEQLLEPEPTDDRTTQAKYSSCFFKGYSRVLDDGYFYRCCTSPFIPRLLQGRPVGSDGVRVDEHLTEAELAAFLVRDTFMESCRTCAGLDPVNRRHQPWREVRDPAAWLRASAGLPA